MRKLLWIGSVVAIAGAVAVGLSGRSTAHSQSALSQPAGAEPGSAATAPAGPSEAQRPTPSATPDSTRDAELGALLAAVSDSEGQERMQAFLALVEGLRTRPELLLALERSLLGAPAASDNLLLGLNALTVLGTPAAQQSMLHLMAGRRQDDLFLTKLVPAMGFVQKPSAELEEALRAVAEGDASHSQRMAQLALGTVASNLAVSDPARASRILNEYATKLKATSSPDEQQAYMKVLGNSGLPEVTQALQPFLDDGRAPVRAQALESLRLVRTPEAEERLVDAIHGDKDDHARGGAAWALSYHEATPSIIDAEAAALAVETNETVARALLANLWSARTSQREKIMDVLTRLAQSHPLASIQAEARHLLAGA